MKTAVLPSIQVEPELLDALESVLVEGETLADFVEAAVRAGVRRRLVDREFMARAIRSRSESRRMGGYVDADIVFEGLQRQLDAARARVSGSTK